MRWGGGFRSTFNVGISSVHLFSFLTMYNILSVHGTSMLENHDTKSVSTQEKRAAGIGMMEQKLATFLLVADMLLTFPAQGGRVGGRVGGGGGGGVFLGLKDKGGVGDGRDVTL